jgi:hypothetical protein
MSELMQLISIVVPVYNEEANVERLHEAVNLALAPIAGRYAPDPQPNLEKGPEGIKSPEGMGHGV